MQLQHQSYQSHLESTCLHGALSYTAKSTSKAQNPQEELCVSVHTIPTLTGNYTCLSKRWGVALPAVVWHTAPAPLRMSSITEWRLATKWCRLGLRGLRHLDQKIPWMFTFLRITIKYTLPWILLKILSLSSNMLIPLLVPVYETVLESPLWWLYHPLKLELLRPNPEFLIQDSWV